MSLKSIELLAEHFIAEVEAKFGALPAELKNDILPAGIKIGSALLAVVGSPIGTAVIETVIPADLFTKAESFVKTIVADMTTVEEIVSLPTEQQQLQAWAAFLQTQTASTKNALVEKFVSLFVRLASGNILPEHITDTLVQSAVSQSKIAA